MSGAPRKIAFVSGKGGVGKTLLAANFALCSSTNDRTVLIDLDFQNQGSSGLLAEYMEPGCLNAFDLFTSERSEHRRAVQVRENLFFVPAFDPSKVDRFASQLVSSFHHLNVEKLNATINTVMTNGDFRLAVMDCHGGLDDVSFASFISSDRTFIVTEPDKVTFNGTLELLDFYVGRAIELKSATVSRFEGSQESEIQHRVSHIQDNKVRILVNRVSGKFTYEGLKDALSHQFYENIEILREMNEGFYFFPHDPLVSESFSEYPFYIELLPESIFSQKIELLYEKVFGLRPKIKGRTILYRVFERVSPRKLERYVKSPHDVRVQVACTRFG